MMMKKNWLVYLSLMFATQNAFAKLSMVGALDYNLDSVSASAMGVSVEVKGGLGFGAGLLVELGKVELGAVFLSKSYTTTITGLGETSTSTSGIHIPVVARFGGGSTTFGVGSFFDLSLESGSSLNYGLTAGPRFGGSNGGLFLDLRFNYGLKSPASKDALALVGYAFGK